MADPTDELKELVEKYSSTLELTDEDRSGLQAVAAGTDAITIPGELSVEAEPDPSESPYLKPEEKKETTDLRARISGMRLPEKLKLAMFGNSVCRRLLVTDSNKIIQSAVLKNPQLQMREVEDFAKNTNCSDNVLRTIANKQEWIKSYGVKRNLVMNPKAPVDITVKWLKFLNAPDVKKISKSKGLPQALVSAAKKKAAEGPDT